VINVMQCDETRPECHYCSQRNFSCEYVQDILPTALKTSSSSPEVLSQPLDNVVAFHVSACQPPSPPFYTSIGVFTPLDHYLLRYYETHVWQRFAGWDDAAIKRLHKDVVPRLGVSHPFLLYSLLSIAATQSNMESPSKQVENQALIYRQKTLESYRDALQHITTDNYEAVLVTGRVLLSLVLPLPSYTEAEYLNWITSMLKLNEGLRILASLRWNDGIEKLAVYPLVQRELRSLPPSPIVHRDAHVPPAGRLGTTPVTPNPPPTYTSHHFPQQTSLFLPPLLASLFENTMALDAQSEPYKAALLPVFQALSPILLSLYYYRLNQDVYIRISAFPSFLMPDFLSLVHQHEPRALVLIAWWFALADLVPQGWWVGENVRRFLAAIRSEVERRDDVVAKEAMCGAERIVQAFESEGGEAAAQSVFEGWGEVEWEEGPTRALEWEIAQWTRLEESDVNGLV
jgi:hypothetical protein